MSMEQDRMEEIEKYLRGDLIPSEKDAFEEKMRLDATLAEEVEMHRTAVFLIKSEGIRQMKKQLEPYSSYTEAAQKNSLIRPSNKWYVLAAAASVILIISFIFLLPQRAMDQEKLFSIYFVPPPADRQLLRNDSEMDERVHAFQVYEQKKYHEATILFEQVIKNMPDNDLLFYAGVSALADNQPDKSISYFEELLKNNNPLYLRRTQWFLSLAYLKSGQHAKAKEYLHNLASEANSYQEKSKELLEDIE